MNLASTLKNKFSDKIKKSIKMLLYLMTSAFNIAHHNKGKALPPPLYYGGSDFSDKKSAFQSCLLVTYHASNMTEVSVLKSLV